METEIKERMRTDAAKVIAMMYGDILALLRHRREYFHPVGDGLLIFKTHPAVITVGDERSFSVDILSVKYPDEEVDIFDPWLNRYQKQNDKEPVMVEPSWMVRARVDGLVVPSPDGMIKTTIKIDYHRTTEQGHNLRDRVIALLMDPKRYHEIFVSTKKHAAVQVPIASDIPVRPVSTEEMDVNEELVVHDVVFRAIPGMVDDPYVGMFKTHALEVDYGDGSPVDIFDSCMNRYQRAGMRVRLIETREALRRRLGL